MPQLRSTGFHVDDKYPDGHAVKCSSGRTAVFRLGMLFANRSPRL